VLTTIDSQQIQRHIFTLRGVQVMIDRDLAELYQVETRALKQAVRRNQNRFPNDFMFVLTDSEVDSLVSQSVIPSKKQLGGAKPFAFTEQGVATLSSVLTSDRAIEINIHIMRAFVQMRRFITHNAVIFQRLESIEHKQGIFFEGQIFDAGVGANNHSPIDDSPNNYSGMEQGRMIIRPYGLIDNG